MTFTSRVAGRSAIYTGLALNAPIEPAVGHEATLHSGQIQVRVKILSVYKSDYTGEISAFTPETSTEHQGYGVGDTVRFLASDVIGFRELLEEQATR